MNLYSTASIHIAPMKPIDAETRYLLRQRLQDALNEAADGVLAELGIDNQEVWAVEVDEIEVEDES